MPMPRLVDIRLLKGASKEVRDYMGNDKTATGQISKAAILLGSAITKILGNIFIRFGKPPFETKLFTDRNKAIDWLKTTE